METYQVHVYCLFKEQIVCDLIRPSLQIKNRNGRNLQETEFELSMMCLHRSVDNGCWLVTRHCQTFVHRSRVALNGKSVQVICHKKGNTFSNSV